MLQDNEDTISFFPGGTGSGQESLGRIVVHDRARVECEVLPRYFNHSSFASLRRQLNYFSFTRVGKGRQRGAIYVNERVVVLSDILRLKRRVVGSSAAVAVTAQPGTDSEQNQNTNQNMQPQQQPEKASVAGHVTPPPLPLLPLKREREDIVDVDVIVDPQLSVSQQEAPVAFAASVPSTNIQPATATSKGSAHAQSATRQRSSSKRASRHAFNSIVPVVHLPPSKKNKNRSTIQHQPPHIIPIPNTFANSAPSSRKSSHKIKQQKLADSSCTPANIQSQQTQTQTNQVLIWNPNSRPSSGAPSEQPIDKSTLVLCPAEDPSPLSSPSPSQHSEATVEFTWPWPAPNTFSTHSYATSTHLDQASPSPNVNRVSSEKLSSMDASSFRDADILAGCNALLALGHN